MRKIYWFLNGNQNFASPLAKALSKINDHQYDLEYYKVFAIDSLENWGIDENDQILENYGDFRNDVTNNFSITCND